MSKNYLMLRGAWDERTQKSIDDDDCMWLQLFSHFVGNNSGIIWYNSDVTRHIEYRNCLISSSNLISCIHGVAYGDIDLIFARGGFDYYNPILKAAKKAYKIYYGAGKRFYPNPDNFCDYNLILVDTQKQKQKVNEIYPNKRCELFIKPAAEHFKPIQCDKEYDVCFIANEQQRAFKGVDWVYETAPKDLKILHLGYHDSLPKLSNITQKRVNRIDMPQWINKCKVAIFPYDNVDSAPRALVECLACGIDCYCFKTVNYNRKLYSAIDSEKVKMWDEIKIDLKVPIGLAKCYGIGMYSIQNAVSCLKNILEK